MRDAKLFAGQRLRRLRESAGESQAALARGLAVSPSYLNQIERDQRPLPRRVLQRICEHFAIGLDYFGESEDLRRAQELREALAHPLFGGILADLSDIRQAVQATPELVRRFLILHRAYNAQGEEMRGAGAQPSAPWLPMTRFATGSSRVKTISTRSIVRLRRYMRMPAFPAEPCAKTSPAA